VYFARQVGTNPSELIRTQCTSGTDFEVVPWAIDPLLYVLSDFSIFRTHEGNRADSLWQKHSFLFFVFLHEQQIVINATNLLMWDGFCWDRFATVGDLLVFQNSSGIHIFNLQTGNRQTTVPCTLS
jgi:hypothetical protein